MKIYFTLSGLLILSLIACIQTEGEPSQPSTEVRQLAQAQCGSCHAYPDPSLLTKDVWRGALPQMAVRMGIPAEGVNPFQGMRPEEISRIKTAGLYPEKPIISDAVWKELVAFYLSEAPEENDLPARATFPNSSPFEPRMQELGLSSSSFISMVKFDSEDRLFVANWNGEFACLDRELETERKVIFPRPVIDFQYSERGEILALSIGRLYPNDGLTGALARLDTQTFSDPQLVFGSLPRPVNLEKADFDQDGSEDLLICNYGNQVGNLAWFQNTESGYQEQVIKNLPGATRTQVADMDGDGDPDIVALFAQGDEGIRIFYNDRGSFREKSVLRFHPLYGSSDFELVDMDGDGDRDIVLANGDNADYSIMLKSYHGVRIFLNEAGDFREQFFFPMYGATKVRARDFDLDGDLDLVVSAFFPDTENALNQSILYLDNQGNWAFTPSHLEHATDGRWMVMDAGDYDGDGDPDVVLGSFTLRTKGTQQVVLNHWNNSKNHILVLENQTNPGVVE